MVDLSICKRLPEGNPNFRIFVHGHKQFFLADGKITTDAKLVYFASFRWTHQQGGNKSFKIHQRLWQIYNLHLYIVMG